MGQTRFHKIIDFTWKVTSLFMICVLVSLSGFFQADSAEASYLLEKRCERNQSKRLKRETRKKICACVVINLTNKLQPDQIRELERIYENRATRISASQDEKLKPVVDLDFEVNKNCSQNSLWRLPVEDIGKPDPL